MMRRRRSRQSNSTMGNPSKKPATQSKSAWLSGLMVLIAVGEAGVAEAQGLHEEVVGRITILTDQIPILLVVVVVVVTRGLHRMPRMVPQNRTVPPLTRRTALLPPLGMVPLLQVTQHLRPTHPRMVVLRVPVVAQEIASIAGNRGTCPVTAQPQTVEAALGEVGEEVATIVDSRGTCREIVPLVGRDLVVVVVVAAAAVVAAVHATTAESQATCLVTAHQAQVEAVAVAVVVVVAAVVVGEGATASIAESLATCPAIVPKEGEQVVVAEEAEAEIARVTNAVSLATCLASVPMVGLVAGATPVEMIEEAAGAAMMTETGTEIGAVVMTVGPMTATAGTVVVVAAIEGTPARIGTFRTK
eukprot:c20019_g1_i1.p2 GENE.c20019_g1_i1~~c20019_g1_i1.p2  ORF type:complete len:359 (+),score=32.01 c20019_g1_i1:228-1304(+)